MRLFLLEAMYIDTHSRPYRPTQPLSVTIFIFLRALSVLPHLPLTNPAAACDTRHYPF